ncbi:MAG TPA: TldD/PmbA family protein, partial [Caulobacteraceae bacterium]|nr:TldD/PmbA family protein [Caulobacteraceae bacterium]
IGVRVFIGQRQASVSGSNLAPQARKRLVERAVAMAKLAPEDKYAGLAPREKLAKGPFPDLELFDAAEPSAEALEEIGRTAEDVMRQVKGVTNSEGGAGTWSSNRYRMVTSTGFSGGYDVSSFSLYASAIAGDGETMERAGEGRSTRWRADLPSPTDIGREAGERAVARLGAKKIGSTVAPVIFERKIASSIMGPLINAISGPAIARGVSFLKDKLGAQVFSPNVTITDEPHRVRGLGSSPYDDEGVANRERAIIDKGVLTTWLLNTASARQLGLETNGHAARGLAGPPGVGVSNLTVQPGTRDLDQMMADAGKGLLVTAMFGPSLNANTGDWSAGVSGFWFENGQLAFPVNEITVAGNLIDIFARVVSGADLEIRNASNAPSLLVDNLAIAGR